MKAQTGRGFVTGLLLGLALSLVVGLFTLYLLIVLEIVSITVVEAPGLQVLTDWTRRNLGLSILPFGITLVLYVHSLRVLAQLLEDSRPADEVSQHDHLVDVWISLYFGIGVIWTAIGMRSALLHALGDPGAVSQSGAYAVLERLVDGGILTALTTTIVGGIGGYLMRVFKSSYLGTRLSHYYEHQEQHHASRVEQLLCDIRTSIGNLAAGSVPANSSEFLRQK